MRPRFPLDIKYRRPTPPHLIKGKPTDWLQPWRARYRPDRKPEYALNGWGDTLEEALADLEQKASDVDQSNRTSPGGESGVASP